MRSRLVGELGQLESAFSITAGFRLRGNLPLPGNFPLPLSPRFRGRGRGGEQTAGNLSSGQDGHEGHAVLIADQAIKMTHFLVDEDNDIRFRKRGG
jgi:hypothetical protein